MSVQEFYRGKTILLTGATGFLGKVILEKLLRTLPNIEKIFILIRQKKGSSLVERYKREVLGSQCFDRLKRSLGAEFDSYVSSKVIPLEGDMLKQYLGLSESDLTLVLQGTNIVINCAASVDFNARLDDSLHINFNGTKNILELCTHMKNLLNFIHTSTSYVNSDKTGWIEEKIYDREITNPMKSVEEMLKTPINILEAQTKEILGGFPNTYTFTKNLAEKMIQLLRPKDMTVTIIRPSIIGASFRDPIPGWIDSIVASAAIYFFSGIGLIKALYGDEDLIGDQIPVDFVADHLIVSGAYYANQKSLEVLNLCTSGRNPATWKLAKECVLEYWNKNPSSSRLTKCTVQFYKNHKTYQLVNQVRSVPAQIFKKVSQTVGSKKMKMQSNRLMKMMQRADQINKTFEHFINNEWIFDSGKTQALIRYLQGTEKEIFQLDVSVINWRNYLLMFNYGLQRFVLKESPQPMGLEPNDVLTMAKTTTYYSDIEWAMNQGCPFKPKSNREHITLVMNSSRVQNVIKQLVDEKSRKMGRGPINYDKEQKEIETEALDICRVMFSDYKMSIIRCFGWSLTKVFKTVYEKVVIDDTTMKALQEHNQKEKGPLILLPTHRSYIDFLICSYVFFAFKVKCPHIATAEDFLNMAVIPTILRASGAFFLKRKSLEDSILYKTIFYEYVQRLLLDDCYLEFFIEGTRSRTGKTLSPKFGLLTIVGDTIFEGKLNDATILPITINYEKVLEADTYPYELLGEEKVKESLLRVLKAARILSLNYGRIYIEFGKTISLKQFALGYNKSLPCIKDDMPLRKKIIQDLAYEIVYIMLDKIVVMPTGMVSSILLMHRKGITEDMLVKKMEWLSQQIQIRGSKTASINQGQVEVEVRNAINLLSDIIVKTKKNIFELQVSPNLEYKNILLLSYYRNQLMHIFVQEGFVCCALNAFGHQLSFKDGVSIQRLWEETDFLLKLLKKEYVLRLNITRENFKGFIELMVSRHVLQMNDGMVKVAETKGESVVQFCCSLIWPLVESYWVTLVYLYSVQRNQSSIGMKKLIQQTQWFAESMYEERVMEHYESCSQETIKNAVSIYKDMNIIQIEKETNAKGMLVEELVSVIIKEEKLLDLENQVKKFLKNAFAKSVQTPFDIARKTMIVDYSFMPKL